jgi:hypothetical protein
MENKLPLARRIAGAMSMLVFALLAYGFYQAHAQPPTPAPTKTSDEPKTNSNKSVDGPEDNRRGSEALPLIVRTVVTKSEAKQEADDRNEKASNDRWMVIFTGILAIVTTALAVYTALLFGATKRMVRGAEDASKKQLGAFVYCKSVKPIAVWKAKNDVEAWKFNPVIENSGSTRTKGLITGSNYKVTPGLDPGFDFPDRKDDVYPTVLVGPHATIEIDGPTITVDQLSSTVKPIGNNKVFMWGWIEYGDVFDGNERQRTEFCFEIIVSGNIFHSDQIPVEGFPFVFQTYPRHNGVYGDEGVKKPRPYPPKRE